MQKHLSDRPQGGWLYLFFHVRGGITGHRYCDGLVLTTPQHDLVQLWFLQENPTRDITMTVLEATRYITNDDLIDYMRYYQEEFALVERDILEEEQIGA